MSKFTLFASITGGVTAAYALYIVMTRSEFQSNKIHSSGLKMGSHRHVR